MNTGRHRPGQLCALLLLGFLVGCTSSQDEQIAWLDIGSNILTEEATAAIPRGIYMDPAIWVEGSSVANFDPDRMPDWASADFDVCVHWQSQYTRNEINSNRSPGEPQRWDIVGVAEGWILLSQDRNVTLELTLSEQGMRTPQIIQVVDAWGGP